MNDYKEIKEQQKAANVRRLMKEKKELKIQLFMADIDKLTNKEKEELENEIQKLQDEADKLSLQLAMYLKSNYPNNFKVEITKLTDNEVYYFNELRNLNKAGRKIFKRITKKYGEQIENHNFLFFDHPQIKYISFLFNDNGLMSGGVVGRRMGNVIKSPDFLNFMEEMGLTIKAASSLYDFSILQSLPYHPVNSVRIISTASIWPNKVSISEKLI